MIFKDYYKILGLENSRVSISEIKAAYREQAKLYHPDVNVGSKISEERFKDINEAYRILSTTSSRRKYDRIWNSNASKQNIKYEQNNNTKNSTVSEIFNMFFGERNETKLKSENNITKNKSKQKVKGENIETSIDVSIQDAFFGTSKTISLKTIDGKNKNFDIKIPAGIRNNEKIRIIGQGKSGINGGNNGDLLINVNIQNSSKFSIKGYDIYTDLLLSPWEAALGTKTKIIGIDDETSIYVPQGIQSGEKIKIPGKGYKTSNGGRGDLIANIKVMVPQILTDAEKEIFYKLKEVSKFNPRTNNVNIN